VSQPRGNRQDDLFRPALEEIINLRHPLVRLAAEIDWGFLAGRFGSGFFAECLECATVRRHGA
jgi:IS5 family transposase